MKSGVLLSHQLLGPSCLPSQHRDYGCVLLHPAFHGGPGDPNSSPHAGTRIFGGGKLIKGGCEWGLEG